jgi:transcriptional regulator with XRE-family HTH domain
MFCMSIVLISAAHHEPVPKKKAPAAPAPPPVVPEPDDTLFGQRLKALRKRRGLSQVELAQRLGLHPSLISQYECGYLRLHGALLVRLAQALQTTADEILATQTTAGAEALPDVDRRFLRRLKHVDKLSRHQQRLLLGTIDAFLAKVS